MPPKGHVSYCRLCGAIAVAQNLCQTHYKRWYRHGDPGAVMRPADWGAREAHPLYVTWKWTDRVLRGHSPEWDDFWQFVADVGERPPRHRLKRRNPDLPFSKENFFWAAPMAKSSEVLKTNAEYQKAWRDANPARAKHHDLKKHYGIGLEEYVALREKQDGKCAICGNGEFAVNPRTGRVRELAVDHCHASKKIRGLLCTNCNKGIGHFKDTPGLLEAALAYLRRHAA